MKTTKNDALTAALYRHVATSVSTEREGWHLSDLIYCNYKTFYRKTGQAPPPTREQMMMFWMGYAAQFFLVPIKPEDARVIVIDGIQMTPDFESIALGGYRIELAEMKSTRKSSRNFNPKNTPHYIMQMQGYCKGLGVTAADLIMYFIHGDYKGQPPTPTLDCWTIEFTQEEIDANWEEMKRHRDILDAALKSGNPPDPFIQLGKWECGYCECGDMCPMWSCF